MEIVEERTVGPSLGAENIELGFRAMWIGFASGLALKRGTAARTQARNPFMSEVPRP